MNTSKKFSWDFSTAIEVGPGIRAKVPQTFADQDCKRIALITDKGLVAAGVVDKVQAAFEGKDVSIAGIFDQVRQDNDTRDIDECAKWYREIGADGILAVGGGSVLDTAKCLKVMLGMNSDNVSELMQGRHIFFYNRPNAKPLGIPHISMPTTAGTGAEVSPGAALLEAESRTKLILFHQFMGSDFAYLDPELTVTLPPKLTAEPAFDSLSHSVESFFSTKANSYSDAFALRSARLVYQHLGQAIDNGNDINARSELQVASSMSVLASVSSLGASVVHNFADAIGPLYGISHGLANAVYLPIVMKNVAHHFRPRIKEFAQGLDIPFEANDDDQQILDKTVAEIIALQEKCGIAAKFDLELEKSTLDSLIKAVKEDPAGRGFPLPEDTIVTCLEESLNFK